MSIDLVQAVHDGFGPGWWPIGEELHRTLTQIDPDHTVVQVKEKFGGLVVYVNGRGKLWDACKAAELKSHTVCELCGNPGQPRNYGGVPGGYVITRCDDCPDAPPMRV